jgi:hypothetical protein
MFQQHLKKAGVAVSGGAMVGVGLIMIPLPTPCGALVAGAGMAVLGTEFPQAQRVLDRTRDAVVHVIETNCRMDNDNHIITIKEDIEPQEEHPNHETGDTRSKNNQEEEEPSIDQEEEEDIAVVRNTPVDNNNCIPQAPPKQSLQPPPPPLPLRTPILEEFSLGNIRDSMKRRAKTWGQKAVPILKMMGTKEAAAVVVNVDKDKQPDDQSQPPRQQQAPPAYDVVPELSPLSVEAHNVPSWSSLSLTSTSGTYSETP